MHEKPEKQRQEGEERMSMSCLWTFLLVVRFVLALLHMKVNNESWEPEKEKNSIINMKGTRRSVGLALENSTTLVHLVR